MIGKTIYHYKILDKLGEGGMGVVYKAEDTRLGRTVALKFLTTYHSSSEDGKSRFDREAKAIAALNHPNICTIHNVDEYEGRPFIVMETVSGKTLRQKLKDEKPDAQTVIDYAIQVTAALKEAHSRGVIHRDIKSDNIMVTDDNRIKVMDFGLAKFKDSGPVTKTGKTIGTVVYMSPEQVRGEPVDERTDIWSLGIVLYEMLAGKLPFSEKYDHAVMYSILNEDPKPLSNFGHSAPPELEALVTRCIAKKPDDRYQSAEELLSELNNIKGITKSESVVNNGPGNSDYIAGLSRYRRPLAGVFAVLVLSFLYMFFFISEDAGPSEYESITESESILLMVLPFTNIGGDPNRQMFCDGLVETITSNLTQISRTNRGLWVVPAQVQEDATFVSASDGGRQFIKSPAEAYRTFGVNYTVSGSLQPIADSLRLTLNLVDAKNNRQVDSSVIDVRSGDVFTLQKKSVESVLTMLDLELSPETEEAIKKGYESDPAAFELYMQGIGNLQRFERIENIEAAIDAFQAAIDIDAQYALAFAGLGEAYWRKYDYTREREWLDKAKEKAETAHRLDADLTQVNITLGLINRGTGNDEKAIENFRDVLSVDPTNADAYRELARAYESVGNIEEAEETYKRAIRLKPDSWAGYSALGTFYYRNNRFNEALEQFKKVTEITPDNHHVYINLGVMYYNLNELDKAQEMFEHSLQLEETYVASSNLATLYFYQLRYEDAARMYETALDIHDGNYMVWGNLGSAYNWIGEREKARETFLRAIELAKSEREINPNDPLVIVNLAAYMSHVGREEEGRSLAEKALEMAPGNTWVMLSASTTFERLGEREKALYWIEEAIEHGHPPSEILNLPDLQDLIKDERFPEISENIRSESE